jgi:hypothetical protein
LLDDADKSTDIYLNVYWEYFEEKFLEITRDYYKKNLADIVSVHDPEGSILRVS